MCTLHGECQKLSQIQLRPFYCSEIRTVGAQLLEEAVESVCRDLLQPEEGSTQSTLVLNTLSWERTEVISRPGPDGKETLGMSDLGVALVSEFLTGGETANREMLCLSLPWGRALLTVPFVLCTT